MREEAYDKLVQAISDAGFEVVDPTDLFRGIDELYVQPSLQEVIDEETPLILKKDPEFFSRYNINIPENPEMYIFDTYYEKGGERLLNRGYHKAKVWFRHFHFFMEEHPDQEQLYHAVDEFKKIFEGNLE